MDQLDRSLLQLLLLDARLPMAELGRRIGLSRTATLARVRRLEAAGTIRGYHADVAYRPGGPVHTARIGIVIRGTELQVYIRRLERFPELAEVETVSGGLDVLACFVTADRARMEAILDCMHGWPETVRATMYVVLERQAGDAWRR